MARINLTHHRKFRRLSRALGSPALALGTLELLWLSAYEAADPFIGGAADIADATGWTGDPDALVALLIGCGLLDAIGPDAFAVHDLWQHAPDYVRKRWIRANPDVAEADRPWRLPNGGQPPPNGGQTPPGSLQDAALPVPSRPDPTRNERQRGGPRNLDPVNPRVLTRLAYELPGDLESEADKKAELKTLAVRYGLNYDAGSVASALDALAHAKGK